MRANPLKCPWGSTRLRLGVVVIVASALGVLLGKLVGNHATHRPEPGSGQVGSAIEGMGQLHSASDAALVAACDNMASLDGVMSMTIVRRSESVGSGDRAGVGLAEPESAPPDAAWQELPRLDFAIGAFLKKTHDLPGRLFFRHTRLNPRDIPLHESEQELLETVLRAVTDRLGELSQAHSSIALLEATSLVQNSSGQYPFTKPQVEEVLQSDGSVVSMDYYTVHTGDVLLPRPGGGAYIVKEEILPGARLAREKRYFLALEIGSALVEFFSARGLMTHAESHVLQEEIVKDITQHSTANGG